MSVNNWSIFDINRLHFPPSHFHGGKWRLQVLRVLSREFVRVAVAACATDVDFFVVCAYLFVTAFIGSTLLFALLLYCAFSFCYRNNFKIFSCWANIFAIATHFLKKHNFSSPFYCFSCSFSFCALSSCSPFCVRAILVLDLVTGTCQLLLCTLCVCVSWTK